MAARPAAAQTERAGPDGTETAAQGDGETTGDDNDQGAREVTESVEDPTGPAGVPSPGNEPAPDPDGGYPAARLRLLQDETPTGPDRRAALARLTDDWLAGLLARHTTAAGLTGTALVAVGGYGRGELSPRSDLDLLLLHDGRADAGALATLADHLWYPVWDLGLALDHSVRTPAQARKAAREDLKVQLGLLDARHLAGDPDLTAAVRTAAYSDWRESAPNGSPNSTTCARNAPHGRANSNTSSNPTSRRPGADCGTPPRSGPSPPPGSPTPRAAAWKPPAPVCSTPATRST